MKHTLIAAALVIILAVATITYANTFASVRIALAVAENNITNAGVVMVDKGW